MRSLQKKVLTATLLIFLSIGVTAQSLQLSLAKKGIQETEFSCYATGRALVILGGTIGTPYGELAETSLSSFVSFSGKALVEEEPDLKGWYNSSELLGPIQSSGVLEAEWVSDGVVYSLTMSFSSDEQTSGLFNPSIDSFAIPVYLGAPPPFDYEFMSYEGELTETVGGVDTTQEISGWTVLTVYKHRNIYRIVVIFELETDGDDLVTILWLNKDYGFLSGASVFENAVDLKKE